MLWLWLQHLGVPVAKFWISFCSSTDYITRYKSLVKTASNSGSCRYYTVVFAFIAFNFVTRRWHNKNIQKQPKQSQLVAASSIIVNENCFRLHLNPFRFRLHLTDLLLNWRRKETKLFPQSCSLDTKAQFPKLCQVSTWFNTYLETSLQHSNILWQAIYVRSLGHGRLSNKAGIGISSKT